MHLHPVSRRRQALEIHGARPHREGPQSGPTERACREGLQEGTKERVSREGPDREGLGILDSPEVLASIERA